MIIGVKKFLKQSHLFRKTQSECRNYFSHSNKKDF